MTGPELRAIRERLGLTAEAFGRLVGYTGTRATIDMCVSRIENGHRPVPPRVELALMRLPRKRAPAKAP